MTDMSHEIVQRAEKAFSSGERQNQEAQWTIISEYIIPMQSGTFQGSNAGETIGSVLGNGAPGSKKTTRLFDSTAVLANRDLAAAMHGTLTNPATKWSKIRYKDEDLNNNELANTWLQQVNKIIHDTLNESNFDTEQASNYSFYTALGSMALLVESDNGKNSPNNVIRFKAIHLSRIAWEENRDGRVDVVHMKVTLTGKQALERFTVGLSSELMTQMKEKPSDFFEFIHSIFPREESQIKLNELGLALDAKNRPFASMYISVNQGNGVNKVVEEGGFYQFPVLVARWETLPGEVYGRGPGHLAIPEARTINRVKDYTLRSAKNAIMPTVLTTRRDDLGALDFRGNNAIVVDDVDKSLKPWNSGARFDVSQIVLEDLQKTIKEIFFLDKLLLPPRTDTGEQTAFEIATRVEQTQRVLGPTTGRLNAEHLTPLVQMVFRILLREGKLPRVPQIVNAWVWEAISVVVAPA